MFSKALKFYNYLKCDDCRNTDVKLMCIFLLCCYKYTCMSIYFLTLSYCTLLLPDNIVYDKRY